MSTISLRLPESLHKAAKQAAQKDHVSINQLVTTALAEKLSALMTEDYLIARAQKAPDRREYKRLIARAGKQAPREDDTL